mmetsp:Transcript_52216/g.93165  ORF Transcript_52216/g.93165 Transcript_52216/m.93165 type:complete len:269 (+) Transcript_52216:1861-2667(+)
MVGRLMRSLYRWNSAIMVCGWFATDVSICRRRIATRSSMGSRRLSNALTAFAQIPSSSGLMLRGDTALKGMNASLTRSSWISTGFRSPRSCSCTPRRFRICSARSENFRHRGSTCFGPSQSPRQWTPVSSSVIFAQVSQHVMICCNAWRTSFQGPLHKSILMFSPSCVWAYLIKSVDTCPMRNRILVWDLPTKQAEAEAIDAFMVDPTRPFQMSLRDSWIFSRRSGTSSILVLESSCHSSGKTWVANWLSVSFSKISANALALIATWE